MKVKDLMSCNVQTVSPQTKLAEAAKIMRDRDIGALPVTKTKDTIGIVTDRDLTVRAAAHHLDFSTHVVEEVMSTNVQFCQDEDDVDCAVELMEQRQVRRLPVVDQSDELVGIISLGDIAQKTNHALSGEALEAISRA